MSLPELKKGTTIYALLKEAGMELQDWPHANYPRQNMRCAWIEGDIVVMNIWMHKVESRATPEGSYVTRYISRGQGHVGEETDRIYLAVIERNLPVQVILHKEKNSNLRILDSVQWSAEYEPSTGEITLTRGKPVRYIDQKGPVDITSYTEESPAVKRSRKLREMAMVRSSGTCELCGKKGFRTRNGAIFAEVHHIVALKDEGPDELSNLIVLCPDDHRRAHHGDNAVELQQAFVKIRNTKNGVMATGS